MPAFLNNGVMDGYTGPVSNSNCHSPEWSVHYLARTGALETATCHAVDAVTDTVNRCGTVAISLRANPNGIT